MLSRTLRWLTAERRSFSAFTRLDSAPPCWLHDIAALLSAAFARLLELPKCSHNTRAKAGRDQHEKKGLVRKRAHKCWNAVTVCLLPRCHVGSQCVDATKLKFKKRSRPTPSSIIQPGGAVAARAHMIRLKDTTGIAADVESRARMILSRSVDRMEQTRCDLSGP
jgi:hypothetical protein